MVVSFINQGFGGSSLLLSANDTKVLNTAPTAIVTYGRFLEYLDNGWVQKVDLYNNAKFAIFDHLNRVVIGKIVEFHVGQN